MILSVELRLPYTRPLKDRFSITADYYRQHHHHDHDHLLNLQLNKLFSLTMDYGLHHHRCCRCVTSVSPSIFPNRDSSLSRGSSLHPFDSILN